MGRSPRSAILQETLRVRAAIRAEYQDALEAQVAAADAATRGNMLNARAPEWARMDDLWLRNEATARAWASPELLDWWAEHGRLRWCDFYAHRLPLRLAPDRQWSWLFRGTEPW